MITDNETTKVYFSSLIKTGKYSSFWNDLEMILVKHNIKPEFIEGTRDLWCRDYMPVQISEKDYVQFKYFPDYYLTHKHVGKLTIQDEIRYDKPYGAHIRKIDLIVDGGNIVSSKTKAIMTEKVFVENKNREEKSVIKMLKEALKVDDLFFLPVQPYDWTGHADGMVRYLDDGRLLVNNYSNESQSWQEKLKNAIEKTGLKPETLPYAHSQEKVDGEHTARGCYINYAQIGNLIIFPQFEINEDGIALAKIKELFPEPDFIVEPIDCNLIAREGGVLNCLTWNIHTPIYKDVVKNILPVYGDENRMLVIHSKDYDGVTKINDALCIILEPNDGKIVKAWSMAKMLKFGYYEPIHTEQDIGRYRNILSSAYNSEQLSNIYDQLAYPSSESLESLVWISPRLKKYKPSH